MSAHLRGFVIGAGHGRALRLFGPLSLQVGPHDGVQRQSSADGGHGRASRGPVSFHGKQNTFLPQQLGACQRVLEQLTFSL